MRRPSYRILALVERRFSQARWRGSARRGGRSRGGSAGRRWGARRFPTLAGDTAEMLMPTPVTSSTCGALWDCPWR